MITELASAIKAAQAEQDATGHQRPDQTRFHCLPKLNVLQRLQLRALVGSRLYKQIHWHPDEAVFLAAK